MTDSGTQDQPIVSVIVVNHNHGKFILSCVRSIEECLKDLGHEIIVVDNHSRDDSCRMLRDESPRVTLIENPFNVGFGRAANQAARLAVGKYLLLVNPDVTLLPGSVEKAVRFMEDHADVALLLPKLLNPDGTLQFSCRTFPTFLAFLYRRTPLGKLFPSHKAIREHLMLDWNHDETREVDWGLGACMLLRREELKGGNLFDERFFLYFEDIDLCLRLKRAGRKVIYYPEAKMVHTHMRDSVRGLMRRPKREFYRSLIKFYWKHRFGR